MTDDIVARLRARNKRLCYSSNTNEYGRWGNVDPLCGEAADEIERLRAALLKIIDEDNGPLADIARDALSPDTRAALVGEKDND